MVVFGLSKWLSSVTARLWGRETWRETSGKRRITKRLVGKRKKAGGKTKKGWCHDNTSLFVYTWVENCSLLPIQVAGARLCSSAKHGVFFAKERPTRGSCFDPRVRLSGKNWPVVEVKLPISDDETWLSEVLHLLAVLVVVGMNIHPNLQSLHKSVHILTSTFSCARSAVYFVLEGPKVFVLR